MKKFIVMSLFVISASNLYGDYGRNPSYDGQQLQQRFRQQQAGSTNQQQATSNSAYGTQSSMPYYTINEKAFQEMRDQEKRNNQQDTRQQYYYYGADNQNLRDDDYEDDEDDNSTIYNTTISSGTIRGNPQNIYYNKGEPLNSFAKNDTYSNETDRRLGEKVRNAIKGGWFSKGYEQVQLDVNNGIVTLRGFVATLDDRKKVEDAVKDVDGVNKVQNNLNIQAPQDKSSDNAARSSDNEYPQDKASNETDRQINKRIRDLLGKGWFIDKYETVNLQTENGIVTIRGFVASFDDHRKLNEEVRKVEGVRSVNNNAQVKE
ncbi:hypothetical protein PHSC3_001287 [Chlamydiales bacterium STE3]|nr:hypothetical protein PHSC3_001287 [Chlamydiales bacterium STE3]